MKESPKVSICTITYGHEKFISQTIDSVLSQEVNFLFDFIIADDCSPDNTETIVKGYINNHSKGYLIKYTRHSANKGMLTNFDWALGKCSGKYIALIDGDDYWIDPYKLQRQVDFLEGNSDYGGIATNSTIKYDDRSDGIFGLRKSRKVKYKDMFLDRQFHTATFMFRNNIDLPEGFSALMAGDTPLFLLVARKSSIYYMDYISAVYRRGSHGATSTHNDLKTEEIKKYNDFLNQIAQEAGISLVDKEKFSRLLPRIIHYFGSKAEGLYFKIYPNAQRHIFDISIFNPLKRVCYRLGLLK